ncbi:MAG: SDR family oxidoreductase, partial [Proteobacteria bacterium]|nr:SDR family oxidoreductase [Pseudomonadota bacterium]
MMTRLYADRLAEYDIGVFEIRPGIIETDMTSVVKEKYDKLIAQGLTPTKRWGQPEDVAKAVGAIAEGRLDFSTGQIINVDGGFHLRRELCARCSVAGRGGQLYFTFGFGNYYGSARHRLGQDRNLGWVRNAARHRRLITTLAVEDDGQKDKRQRQQHHRTNNSLFSTLIQSAKLQGYRLIPASRP